MSRSRHAIQCQECATPVAELRPGSLIIKSRHHNKWHVTVIPFDQLRKWMEMAEREDDERAA